MPKPFANLTIVPSAPLAAGHTLAAPMSIHVPRLADFRFADKSRLVSTVVMRAIVQALEAIMIAALGMLIAKFYVAEADIYRAGQYGTALAATGVLTVAIFGWLGLYKLEAMTSPMRQLPKLLVGWMMALAVLILGVFMLKVGPEFSRVWLVSWFALGLFALVTGRLVLTLMTRRWIKQGRMNRRAVIYGGGPDCERLLASLEADLESDIRICGIFDDRGDDRVGPLVSGYPKLGRLEDLIEFGRKTRVDLVILTLPMAAEMRIMQLLRLLWVMPVDIRLAANTKLRFRPHTYSFIGSVPLLDLCDKPLDDWGNVVKSVFDKIVGAVALVLLSPVMAGVAIAIKRDSKGPVLFKQKRYGFNNELIEVYKFRSMYTDMTDADASKLVTRHDPRVTPVGRFIRKTSLDELPQLFNVLNGSLSLVGPRPHAVQAKAADKLYGDVVDGYFARHKVRPGITGWAQINGWRGETDTSDKIQKRVEHDLYYIDNWSVLLDLYILVRTPFSLISTDNAY
jgi:Undecaprenyl-phosphate glucose phosphotransferase